MQALLGAATLGLLAGALWVSPAAAGGTNLRSPQNVEVYIVDDNFILKWNRSNEAVGNVTFSADYLIPGMDNWMKLPGCQYVTSTKCNFSSLKLNVYEKIKLRIRAEKGNNTSPWYELDSFIPFQKAHIGPPKVHLEAEDKAIIINISPPGAHGSIMWAMDNSSFTYSLVIWKNSSSTEERTETVYPRDKIYKLSPETVYCLKVKARLWRKVGSYSPVYCISTTVENKLPAPENIQISAKDQVYVLNWDYMNENVTFQAQWLYAYLKKIPGNHLDKWKQIPDCENVKTTQCAFPQNVFPKGIYFIRVQASNGNNTSLWSEEKKFYGETQTIIFPPVLNMKSINDDSLHVYIGVPKDSDNKSVNQPYPLIYEITFWENTSNAESKILKKKTDFTFPNLKPLTVYCVKARAVIEDDKWNKSSVFSDTVCEKTKSVSGGDLQTLRHRMCSAAPAPWYRGQYWRALCMSELCVDTVSFTKDLVHCLGRFLNPNAIVYNCHTLRATRTISKGNTSKTAIIAGICAALIFILVVIYVVKVLLRCVNYVFFPTSKPPSMMDEYFSEQPLKNLLLSASEEQTERCFIIENTNTLVTVEETNEVDEDHKIYNSQTSQDSGNYSNEDENSMSKISEELQQETM